MRRLKLTDRFIRSITPEGREEYIDSVVPQLMLRASPTKKSFALLARYGGRKNPARRSLGRYYDGDPRAVPLSAEGLYERAPDAAITLGEARSLAHLWLGLISRGVDPASQKRAAQMQAKAKQEERRALAATVFERVAAEWIRRKLPGLRHELEIERLVRKEFVSRWWGRPIDDITRDEYRQAIRAIAEDAPYQAHAALGHLRRLLNWADESGEFNGFISPLKDVKPAAWIDGKTQARTRILTHDELRAVWRAATAESFPFGDVVRLLILSGQRLREVADLSWPEIDLDGRLITIPAQRMKGKAAHEVPLAPQALALLQGLPRFTGPYLFSLKGGIRPVGGFDRAKVRLDQASGVTDWRLHDLRRTARSGFSALPNFEDHVREAVLDHRASGIKRVYDLHRYYDEKLGLLTQWEWRLLAIFEPEPPRIAAVA
jgi:integrase